MSAARLELRDDWPGPILLATGALPDREETNASRDRERWTGRPHPPDPRGLHTFFLIERGPPLGWGESAPPGVFRHPDTGYGVADSGARPALRRNPGRGYLRSSSSDLGSHRAVPHSRFYQQIRQLDARCPRSSSSAA